MALRRLNAHTVAPLIGAAGTCVGALLTSLYQRQNDGPIAPPSPAPTAPISFEPNGTISPPLASTITITVYHDRLTSEEPTTSFSDFLPYVEEQPSVTLSEPSTETIAPESDAQPHHLQLLPAIQRYADKEFPWVLQGKMPSLEQLIGLILHLYDWWTNFWGIFWILLGVWHWFWPSDGAVEEPQRDETAPQMEETAVKITNDELTIAAEHLSEEMKDFESGEQYEAAISELPLKFQHAVRLRMQALKKWNDNTTQATRDFVERRAKLQRDRKDLNALIQKKVEAGTAELEIQRAQFLREKSRMEDEVARVNRRNAQLEEDNKLLRKTCAEAGDNYEQMANISVELKQWIRRGCCPQQDVAPLYAFLTVLILLAKRMQRPRAQPGITGGGNDDDSDGDDDDDSDDDDAGNHGNNGEKPSNVPEDGRQSPINGRHKVEHDTTPSTTHDNPTSGTTLNGQAANEVRAATDLRSRDFGAYIASKKAEWKIIDDEIELAARKAEELAKKAKYAVKPKAESSVIVPAVAASPLPQTASQDESSTTVEVPAATGRTLQEDVEARRAAQMAEALAAGLTEPDPATQIKIRELDMEAHKAAKMAEALAGGLTETDLATQRQIRKADLEARAAARRAERGLPPLDPGAEATPSRPIDHGAAISQLKSTKSPDMRTVKLRSKKPRTRHSKPKTQSKEDSNGEAPTGALPPVMNIKGAMFETPASRQAKIDATLLDVPKCAPSAHDAHVDSPAAPSMIHTSALAEDTHSTLSTSPPGNSSSSGQGAASSTAQPTTVTPPVDANVTGSMPAVTRKSVATLDVESTNAAAATSVSSPLADTAATTPVTRSAEGIRQASRDAIDRQWAEHKRRLAEQEQAKFWDWFSSEAMAKREQEEERKRQISEDAWTARKLQIESDMQAAIERERLKREAGPTAEELDRRNLEAAKAASLEDQEREEQLQRWADGEKRRRQGALARERMEAIAEQRKQASQSNARSEAQSNLAEQARSNDESIADQTSQSIDKVLHAQAVMATGIATDADGQIELETSIDTAYEDSKGEDSQLNQGPVVSTEITQEDTATSATGEMDAASRYQSTNAARVEMAGRSSRIEDQRLEHETARLEQQLALQDSDEDMDAAAQNTKQNSGPANIVNVESRVSVSAEQDRALEAELQGRAAEAEQSALDEEEQRQAEAAAAAFELQQREQQRLAQRAEEQRLASLAEERQITQEAEEKRIAEEAEQARLAVAAETAKKAEEQRLADEARKEEERLNMERIGCKGCQSCRANPDFHGAHYQQPTNASKGHAVATPNSARNSRLPTAGRPDSAASQASARSGIHSGRSSAMGVTPSTPTKASSGITKKSTKSLAQALEQIAGSSQRPNAPHSRIPSPIEKPIARPAGHSTQLPSPNPHRHINPSQFMSVPQGTQVAPPTAQPVDEMEEVEMTGENEVPASAAQPPRSASNSAALRGQHDLPKPNDDAASRRTVSTLAPTVPQQSVGTASDLPANNTQEEEMMDASSAPSLPGIGDEMDVESTPTANLVQDTEDVDMDQTNATGQAPALTGAFGSWWADSAPLARNGNLQQFSFGSTHKVVESSSAPAASVPNTNAPAVAKPASMHSITKSTRRAKKASKTDAKAQPPTPDLGPALKSMGQVNFGVPMNRYRGAPEALPAGSATPGQTVLNRSARMETIRQAELERQRQENARKKQIEAENAERARQAREAAYDMAQMRVEIQKIRKAAEQNGDAMAVEVAKPPTKNNKRRVDADFEQEGDGQRTSGSSTESRPASMRPAVGHHAVQAVDAPEDGVAKKSRVEPVQVHDTPAPMEELIKKRNDDDSQRWLWAIDKAGLQPHEVSQKNRRDLTQDNWAKEKSQPATRAEWIFCRDEKIRKSINVLRGKRGQAHFQEVESFEDWLDRQGRPVGSTGGWV